MRRVVQAMLLCLLVLLPLWSPSSIALASSSVEQAVDRNGNCIIGDPEILWAVEYWITGELLPGTAGLAIDDGTILKLVELWITGESVCAGPTDHMPQVLALDIDPNPALPSDHARDIYNYFDLIIRFADARQDVSQAQIRVTWPDGSVDDHTETITAQDNASGAFRSLEYWSDYDGTISFTVVLVDSVGNRSQPFTKAFSIVSPKGPPAHPPVISWVDCPSEILAGQTVECKVGFSDAAADIVEARFVKVAGGSGSVSFDPGVYGSTRGSFPFKVECHSPTPQQTMEVTLRDKAGNRSAPEYFSYTCVGASPGDVDTAFLALINQYRSESTQCWDMSANVWISWPGSASRNLTLSSPLTDASVYHSQFMADRDCFEHQCPGEADLRTRVERFGYTGWSFIGENIAAGMESSEDAFEAWENSPGHNRNMLTCQFSEIGVGRVYDPGDRYQWYWTADFGSR